MPFRGGDENPRTMYSYAKNKYIFPSQYVFDPYSSSIPIPLSFKGQYESKDAPVLECFPSNRVWIAGDNASSTIFPHAHCIIGSENWVKILTNLEDAVKHNIFRDYFLRRQSVGDDPTRSFFSDGTNFNDYHYWNESSKSTMGDSLSITSFPRKSGVYKDFYSAHFNIWMVYEVRKYGDILPRFDKVRCKFVADGLNSSNYLQTANLTTHELNSGTRVVSGVNYPFKRFLAKTTIDYIPLSTRTDVTGQIKVIGNPSTFSDWQWHITEPYANTRESVFVTGLGLEVHVG